MGDPDKRRSTYKRVMAHVPGSPENVLAALKRELASSGNQDDPQLIEHLRDAEAAVLSLSSTKVRHGDIARFLFEPVGDNPWGQLDFSPSTLARHGLHVPNTAPPPDSVGFATPVSGYGRGHLGKFAG